MTTSECDAAYGVLDQWKADVDWTKTQHRVGASFGAENCEPTSKSLDDQACEALNGSSSGALGGSEDSEACAEGQSC